MVDESQQESASMRDRLPGRTLLRWMTVLVLGLGVVVLLVVSDVVPMNFFKEPPRSLADLSSSSPTERKNLKLDFFIAGFEKCGTTYMLRAFENHKETDMAPMEQCYLSSGSHSSEEIYEMLENELRSLSQDPGVKLGIKCPRGLRLAALNRLRDWFPDMKILIALRHPVHYFRSFYNFRVSMTHKKHPNMTIPPIETLVGSNEWLKVSTDNARFEYDLMRLGKTKPKTDYQKRYPPTPFKVLLYSLEQLSDEDQERHQHFSRRMADFLEIENPIHTGPRLSRAPQHKFDEFNESIDICQSKYADLRAILVEQAKKTSRWIRDEFLKSPDVTVINKDHFLDSLRTWDHDPCLVKSSKR